MMNANKRDSRKVTMMSNRIVTVFVGVFITALLSSNIAQAQSGDAKPLASNSVSATTTKRKRVFWVDTVSGSHFKTFTAEEKQQLQEEGKAFNTNMQKIEDGDLDGAYAFFMALRKSETAKGPGWGQSETIQLADIEFRRGNDAAALGYFKEVCPLVPLPNGTYTCSNPVAQMKYALLLQKAGRYDEALVNYQAGLNQSSGWSLPKPPTIRSEDVPTDRFVFAASLVAASRLNGFHPMQAASFARRAIAANPTNGVGYYYLGKILQFVDAAEAQTAYKKAMMYGHGDYLDSAKRGLTFTTAQVEKVQATAKP